MKKRTVCLNMIVKNESHVIQRCLASVRPLIDYWVIVDTGSTDGTQKIIEDFMEGTPGELHERPWVNFGHNRNEALDRARGKADYILFIDADDFLVFADDFVMPDLVGDCYCVRQNQQALGVGINASTMVVLLIKDLPDFLWEGAVHETILFKKGMSYALLEGVANVYSSDGSRSQDKEKYQKDIEMLKKAVQDDPENSRNVFYLARSYTCLGEYPSSLPYYAKRATMNGGREDEIFYSLFSIGLIQKRLKENALTIQESFCKAFLSRPARAESLYALAEMLIEEENYVLGYLVAQFALSIPLPNDPFELWLVPWIYDWGIRFQLYRCARRLGEHDEANELLQILLSNPKLPLQQRRQIEPDLMYCKRRK
jgi:glycosyltransferase involved in cell wall biosynthesis